MITTLHTLGMSKSTTASLSISVVVFFVVLIGVRMFQRLRSLPPGPWFYQFTILLGAVSTKKSSKRYERVWAAMSKRYGKIFSFGLGVDTIVVLNDIDIIREAFVNKREVFSNRRSPHINTMCFPGNECGLINSNGQIWKTTRRIVSPCLRNAGSWGQQMESIIIQEADCLITRLSNSHSKPFDPSDHISTAVFNVIHTLTHGYRMDDDLRVKEIIQAFTLITSDSMRPIDVFRYAPFLFYLPSIRPLRQAHALSKRLMTTAVSNHQERLYDGSTSNINTIIERMMLAAEEDVEGGTGEVKLKTKDIWRVLLDILIAGFDTTTNSLRWALLIMAHHPEIQKKIHLEIDAVLEGRGPRIHDQSSMPYTRAALLEVLRIRPIAPLTVRHITSKKSQLRGYTIPKGAVVFGNIWVCHQDPEIWEDPETFNPDRFLSEDGQSLRKEPSAFIPFSVGPRMCTGEQLARNEFFLVFTKIMQHFDVDFAPGDRPAGLDEGIPGLLLRPSGMNLIMVPRAKSTC